MTIPPSRGFLFDVNRCTGCHACELACSTENELDWGSSWRQVVTYNPQRIPSIASHHLSLACNHCADAPCMPGCPALAIGRDRATGAVLIDAGKCMGCKYCSWACPYDALHFDGGRRVMTKCTWCSHRLAEGKDPACVELCPTSALGFGELVGETAVPGFPETPARPSIRFTAAQPGRPAPEATWELPAGLLRSFEEARLPGHGTISLRGEWTLLVFTLLVAALAGWIVAAQGSAAPPPLPLFLAGLGLAAAGATLHLGRKSRMWRAILNVRRSWLSREVAAFSSFGAAATLSLARPDIELLGPVAAGLGLATLFAVDRVYDPVRPPGPRAHSADTLLTGALIGLLPGSPPALAGASLLVLVKLSLYILRLRRDRDLFAMPAAGLVRGLRVIVLLPTVPLIALSSGGVPPAAWLLFAAGEIIDRVLFYQGLRTVSPHRTAAADLAAARRSPRVASTTA